MARAPVQRRRKQFESGGARRKFFYCAPPLFSTAPPQFEGAQRTPEWAHRKASTLLTFKKKTEDALVLKTLWPFLALLN